MASDCLCSSMFATLCRFCCKSQIFKKLCENPFFSVKTDFSIAFVFENRVARLFVENKQHSIEKTYYRECSVLSSGP